MGGLLEVQTDSLQPSWQEHGGHQVQHYSSNWELISVPQMEGRRRYWTWHGLWNFKVHARWHTSSNKVIPQLHQLSSKHSNMWAIRAQTTTVTTHVLKENIGNIVICEKQPLKERSCCESKEKCSKIQDHRNNNLLGDFWLQCDKGVLKHCSNRSWLVIYVELEEERPGPTWIYIYPVSKIINMQNMSENNKCLGISGLHITHLTSLMILLNKV